jgi:HD-GYP domain-containing protein (c-di-GMP phosphodiesterase class II)
MVMKHPYKGVEMIKDLEALKPVIPIILHHHERFDGQGYPAGFKEDQIPIGSRILSVLDAFDAMFFGRPYRKRKQLGEIEQELTLEMGKQFDPKVVEVLLRVLKRKAIKKHLQSFL